MKRRSITSKIILSYFTIVVASLTIVGILINVAIKNFVEKQAKEDLLREARFVYEFYRNSTGNRNIPDVRKKLRFSVGTIILNRLDLESRITIVEKDAKDSIKIVFPQERDEVEWFNKKILAKLNPKLEKGERESFKVHADGVEYMGIIYRAPIKLNTQDRFKAWIILYTPLEQVHGISRRMSLVLFITLLATGILSVIYGVFSARSIAKPIIKLKQMAQLISKRDFDTRVDIKTGDEIEDLAGTMQKMAYNLKEYDIAQKKFLQNASHELKTPLMSIQGYAEGIKDGVFDDTQKALDIIVEESTRLKKLVEELVFLSKLETMEDFYDFKDESMNETIDKSVEKIRSIAYKSNIRINTMLYKDACIPIDKDKFMQALINILGNCIRYAKNEINITTSNDGINYEVKISDDGDGFDEKDLNNIFKRFYKGRKGNTGLGLAITKVIVEKHGGTIKAANDPEGGAQFIISLRIK